MAVLEVRNIICPLCDKGLMAFLQDLSYEVAGYPGFWEKLKCPKCETEIFISDTWYYCLLAEEVSAIQKRIIL